jgi:acyl-CoA thioesterase-2
MRTPPADPALAPALAAYATDLTLIGTALRGRGVSQRDAARFQAGLNRTTAAPSRQTAWTATIHSGRVGRGGRVHRQGGQLGAAEQQAAARLGEAEQDAELASTRTSADRDSRVQSAR